MSEDLTKTLHPSDSKKLTLTLSRLDKIEETLDERLYDTRPICQKVTADIGQLQGTFDQLQKGQEAVRSDCEEIKMSVRDIYGSFEVLTEAIVGTQVRNRDLERRVKALESNSNPPNSQT
jgi:archaellum component FlaC